MRDHTHKFEMALFLTVGALFGVASMYASQFAPLLFAGSDQVQEARAVRVAPSIPESAPATSGALKISLSSADATQGFGPYTDEPEKGRNVEPGVSVVPNATSCPSTAAGALSQPLTAAPAPQANPQRPPLQNGAALGTGTGCPPAAPDTGVGANATAPKALQEQAPSTDIARSGGLAGSAAKP